MRKEKAFRNVFLLEIMHFKTKFGYKTIQVIVRLYVKALKTSKIFKNKHAL